jgi:hypothetical protein
MLYIHKHTHPTSGTERKPEHVQERESTRICCSATSMLRPCESFLFVTSKKKKKSDQRINNKNKMLREKIA